MQADVLGTGTQQLGYVSDSLLHYFSCTVTLQTTVPVEVVDFILDEEHTLLCKVTNN
jgi:hypothetical protein